MGVRDFLKLVAVGDCIIGQPISGFDELVPITQLLMDADITLGNFEGTLIDELHTIESISQLSSSGWILGSLNVAADLRLLGFDMFSRANNHVLDFGPQGMRFTNSALSDAAVLVAGSGNDRHEARAPAILRNGKGTMALISATTTFAPGSRATAPSGFLPGMPGANVLRTTRYTLVSATQLDTLNAIRRELPAAWIPPHEPPDEVELLGIHYRSSERRGFEYCVDSDDRNDLLEDIRKAAKLADVVICSLHSHEPGNWSNDPPDFVRHLARDLIDAGARAIIGHGPHRLRGVEMYCGCPIFYSLGNFIFQISELHPVLDVLYATELEADAGELEAVCKNLLFGEETYYHSVVASVSFGGVTEVRLTPIELRYDAEGAKRGVPRLAPPEVALIIVERLQQLSAPFRTEIRVKDGVGVIGG